MKPFASFMWVIVGTLVLCGCRPNPRSFPPEADSRARARVGMTRDEIVAEFGSPTFEDPGADQYGHRALIYLPPPMACDLPFEGYSGFQLLLHGERLTEYRVIAGKPACAPLQNSGTQ